MGDLGEINWLAVLVAVVAAQVLGFLWYGPLFQKTWIAALGKSREEIEPNQVALVVSVVASALAAIGIAIILTMSNTPDLPSGIKIGALAAIGFAVPTIITQTLYEDRSMTLGWIYSGYMLVALLAMGAILGAWT